MSGAFYAPEGDLFRPLTPATGSWNRKHQNGVAISGLLVHALEAHPAAQPMQTVRLTTDIMRAVPFQPIAVRVRPVREAKRMQVLDAEILADGQVVAQASAVRIRLAETPSHPAAPLPYAFPENLPIRPVTRVLSSGHPMETLVAAGDPKAPGPGAYWTRINADVVEGVRPSPSIRAVMAADIASATSSILDSKVWTYANVDLSVYFTRPPEGDWVLTDCETETCGNGVALVSSVLADRAGPFACANQTLFIAPREG